MAYYFFLESCVGQLDLMHLGGILDSKTCVPLMYKGYSGFLGLGGIVRRGKTWDPVSMGRTKVPLEVTEMVVKKGSFRRHSGFLVTT